MLKWFKIHDTLRVLLLLFIYQWNRSACVRACMRACVCVRAQTC